MTISGDMDERDIQHIRTNDQLIRRYFKHVFETGGVQTEKAKEMIVNSLKFRKENNMLGKCGKDTFIFKHYSSKAYHFRLE